jgi:hypothetical protein
MSWDKPATIPIFVRARQTIMVIRPPFVLVQNLVAMIGLRKTKHVRQQQNERPQKNIQLNRSDETRCRGTGEPCNRSDIRRATRVGFEFQRGFLVSADLLH